MKSSFTEENFENFIKESIGRRGGGRGMFGSFSKDITFSTVPEDSIQAEDDIKISEEHESEDSSKGEDL
jgi:hypothetical protein